MDGHRTRESKSGTVGLARALACAVVALCAGVAAAQSGVESLPLGVGADSVSGAAGGVPASGGGFGEWIRLAAALGGVIGVILVLAGAAKRVSARTGLAGELGAGGRAPSGVLEVLGRYPVSRGQSLVLIRMGGRVLLLSQHAGAGFRTLCDVEDTDEVADLIRRASRDEERTQAEKFKGLLARFDQSFDRAARAGERQGQAGLGPTVRRVAVNKEGDRAELLTGVGGGAAAESGSLSRLLSKLGGERMESGGGAPS